MEILHKFKQNGYFTAELYHLLAKKKILQTSEEVTPSEYMREMSMSTQDRLKNLNNMEVENIVRSGHRSSKVVLSFTPRLLVFQNFKPNDKMVAKFSVKNISKAPTFLNMVYKESSYFSIKPCGSTLLSRLAPGISVTFAITFVPVQVEDYIHRVTFYTDLDQYVLPLIAMGPRPVFDFPDSISIPKTPLKVENQLHIAIHNIGMVPAGFVMNTKCPFSVYPKSAYLNPDQKVDIKVAFKTMHLGEMQGILYILFETGENFRIELTGETHTVSLQLEKEIVRFPDTYNTMVRQQTVKIINKSDHLLTYMCMKNDCIYYDFQDKVKFATMLYGMKSNESSKDTKLVHYDVLSSDEHDRVYTRIFLDEIQSLVADETLIFQNTHFSITPIQGKLWPNKPTDLTITFNPKEIGEFVATAYLDVDGVVDRMPLKMAGASLPPAIQLNLETLDMDTVYINKTYNYEIVATNKGYINGVIEYKDEPTLFGSIITCTPELHCLRPGDKEMFIISFSNSNQGPYFEEINFSIRGTNVLLKVYLKGEVTYPSLSFSVACLDFGTVSIGVPKTLEFKVINESIVQVNASVKISTDGPEVSSITLEDYAVALQSKPEVPQWPREFNIVPCKVVIEPESRVSLQVTLTANLIRANQTSLELELEKSDSPPIVLPVLFNAVVPKVTPAADIRLRACFIEYPYKQDIQIICDGYWGYFTLEDNQTESTLQVTVDIKEGIIKPNSAINIPLTIQTCVLGVQEYVIRMRLFGMRNPIDICNIIGCGVRPIVTCTPMALHWGQVKLLNKSQKILTLCNDSPVNVNFRAMILNKDTRWQIYPTQGYIGPEEEKDLYLTVYLIDAGAYSNKAMIQLEKVKDILVPLTATGVGTSIVVGELRDKIMLGRHFTKIPLNCKVTMENCGTRLHSLEWNEFYKAPKSKQHAAAFFALEPRSCKIASGEKIELTTTGLSYKATVAREMWYLVGSVEGINKKELLMECLIVAEFVDPKIELSSTLVDFQYDYGPYSEFYKLTDIITIKNVSKLPLDVDISVRPPFAMLHRSDTYKILPENENECCCIRYHLSDLNISKILSESDVKQSQTYIDYLTMEPVEPLRQGSLHFFQDINKIKMAFNLTHAVEEHLEDQEVMKLQILFDTTKHLSLKSRVYCDLMRIKFKGHKNKDAVKLIGRIHFPNILIMSPRLDFQCLLNGSVESKTIKIQNVTPLLVCYQLQWKKTTVTKMAAVELPMVEYSSETTVVQSLTGETTTGTDACALAQCRILPKFIHKTNEIEDTSKDSNYFPDAVALESLYNDSNEDTEYEAEDMKMRTLKKVIPMLNGIRETEFSWSYKLRKIEKPIKVDINDVFQLVPSRGLLKPNEVQYIHVIFKPTPNINVRALLECEVLGGPSESIIINGQSSDLLYKINTQKINFKIRAFHDIAYENLLISNIAKLPFEYITYLNEPKLENELEGTIISLVPPEKILEPEEEAEIQIVMRPGVVGYFKRVFLLEIGHLPHIPIEVFGWGVIPQVYLSLPRPGIANLHHELGYLAIPSLTQGYMSAKSEFFVRKGTSEHLNSPLIEKCFEDPDFSYDWHICSLLDDYPSTVDIELAIERMLVSNHIKLRPELLKLYSNNSKSGPIPGFNTIPYIIDYGVVITGSTVQCTTEITNYGPIPLKLHLAKIANIPSWLGIKLSGKLMPGEGGKLEVIFSPTSISFTELEQYVELTIYLEVPYGVTIPVEIKALCAVPYLMSNVSSVDFGSVRCGDKIIYSIPLKNVGKPTCIWYATLRLKGSGQSPMVVMDSSGMYEPGEGGWLSLSFKPIMEETYEALLIFRFHMNPNRMTIPVTGKGVLPHVHIIGPNVNFPPTLPWAETTSIYFGLTNPCPFPIEVILAHSDLKWKEEEEIYNLLNNYYDKPSEILVPLMSPGHGLPWEIIHFKNTLQENIRKCADEEAAALRVSIKAAAVLNKKSKSFKAKSHTSTRSEGSPRHFRTRAEIMADELSKLKQNNVDPLRECLHVCDPEATDNNHANLKGIIIFFHGSPCEEIQCQEIAYAVGKALRIPTISLDHSVIDALCISECPAKHIMMSAINDTYEMLRQDNKGDSEELNEDAEEMFGVTEDEFQIISRKLEYIINTKNVGTTPRSKASDKRKKRSPTSSVTSQAAVNALTLIGSPTIFQTELLQELLVDYFSLQKFNKGFVVDCLTSYIIKIPQLVLTTILKCKQIWNIHLVLCQSDFNKWVQAYEDAQKENESEQNAPKVYDGNEIAQIIQSFEEMTREEYENAPEELKDIYIVHGLDERRRRHIEKNRISSELNMQKKDKTYKDVSKSLLNLQTESRKKIRKEDNKGKPSTEFMTMNAKYIDYTKNVYENLIIIANNWIFEESEIGAPIYGFNGQVVGAAQKKGKKRSELQLQTSEVILTERGFPLTLIMCPCSHYKDAVVEMFTESALVQEALKDEVEPDILECPEKIKKFTVLLPKTFPIINHVDSLQWCNLDELPIKKCVCNQLTDLDLLDDSTQDNILNILSKWHCMCGKKVTSSQTSTSGIPSFSVEKITGEQTETESFPLPLHSVRSISPIGNRLVLQPGDLVRCKFTFSPCDEGNFSIKRFVEVNGWPESRVDVNTTGICDLPRIDSRPKKMFPNFARRTLEDKVYKVTYLDDQQLFEFGPIFIGRLRVYEEEYTLNLKNASLMPAEIEIEFLEDTEVFDIDKTLINLDAGCRDQLKVSAAPSVVGVHTVTLLFCIKNNPEIVTVSITCTGVVPNVEILPFSKIIDYGKLLLYRREDDRFIVKNDSILPIMWKIQNTEDFLEDFIMGKTSGLVPRYDNQVVPVTYIACSVGVITNKVLTIEIYDEYGRGEPMIVDSLLLSAECYDVMVECAYENPNESFLNFGNVKVNSTVYQEMYLLNRGKYNIYYKIKKVKNFPEPALLKSFEGFPECGMIPPTQKLSVIEFECTPVTSINLVNVPAYTCSLLDGSKDQVVVAKFPVCVTIASFYNTFTLFPLGELNFHIIAVGSGVLREVILNNTSKCPFTYEIILPRKYQVDPSTPPVPTKGKDHKIKNPPMRCGNFLIMNDDNLLAPGTSRTLQIQFLATAAKTFEETIHFIISDTCPAEANGVPLKLVGTGAMPTLDFWNLETTFREHLIVKDLSEYQVPESSPHCVFVENSVTLHFFCVTVNTSYTGSIDLYNNGLVACVLSMMLHYQTNTNQRIFSLDKYETHIEPLLHKNLGITFTPNSLKEYRAVLEIRVKLLDNKEQSFNICLIGEGVIPRIELVSPALKHQKMAVLKYPITCLGSVSCRAIRFKNITSVKSVVVMKIKQGHYEDKPIFWATAAQDTRHMVLVGDDETLNVTMKCILKPNETATINVHFFPIKKGRISCDTWLTIEENPYEYFMVVCEAEAFMEDVILTGLEMISMDIDLEAYKASAEGSSSRSDGRKKGRTSASESKKPKIHESKKRKMSSAGSVRQSDSVGSEASLLKYILDFGGCELSSLHRRSVTMVNKSQKVYKFNWMEIQYLVIKPSAGYISPGEEKDLEIMFSSRQPIVIKKESTLCNLYALNDGSLTTDMIGAACDNRHIMTIFDQNKDVNFHEKVATPIYESEAPPAESCMGSLAIAIVYSATTEYTKYTTTLMDEMVLRDTYIYQTRTFGFDVENTSNIPMKISWNFLIDEEFPARVDKSSPKEVPAVSSTGVSTIEKHDVDGSGDMTETVKEDIAVSSKETLFSDRTERESVDTWFEIELPFRVEPPTACLAPATKQTFTLIFSPLDAFDFNVRLKSNIENLSPYNQNTTCKIMAKSLIPYCHLDIEESDYLTSGRRKGTGVILPPHMSVLEFNVLGPGCYHKSFNVINPTDEAYEFIFEMVISDKPELIPVHCNMLKGHVESGTSAEVTFTFAPTAPGVYESHWKFIIPVHSIVMHILVVGFVREPDVVFVPTILVIRNSLVGFTITDVVILKNNESESLKFEFKGNSLCNESGKTPVIMDPEFGTLKPHSETPINMIYTPIQDGPLSFKIFCSITYMTKYLTLCVNALSHSIKPKVTYHLIGNEHILNSEAITNIHLDQTASTYERTIPFVIRNDGSATFFFDWHYSTSNVKKYLDVSVEPKNGHIAPANEEKCSLRFTLRQVPAQAFPVRLSITDGPEYSILIHAKIEKPLYHFSCKGYDFGKCIVNAPDTTYKKNIAFVNDDKVPITINLNFSNLPELFVDIKQAYSIMPGKQVKISILFRPKQVREYEFTLQFWVNSLCEELLTIKGEGVPLLYDLYEGCQKSFNLGPVKVGEKIVRMIEVMNHSKVAIDASFIFKDMYPSMEDKDKDTTPSEATSICLSPSTAKLQNDAGTSRVQMLQSYKDDKIREQILMDVQNALSSLKVIPNKCRIKPHQKVPLKIQFKPVGLISTLDVQLNMKVFQFERPLVRLSGSATGMSFCLSQNSLQFGRVRKRGCKILKVMLHNKGDFGSRFRWQPLVSDEFTISPQQGNIAARTKVTFTITFRPHNHNPFIKVWASCNIDNYMPLELAMYATCVDQGSVQNQTLYLECPVREVHTEYVTVTNPSDEMWLVLSEISGGPFETLREFNIEANSTFNIPIHFKPKTIGKHESQVLYSPLGESALFITLIGAAVHPNPNGTIYFTIDAKETHTEELPVNNITEFPESYLVSSELIKTVPDKFDSYYEIKHPETIKVWGEAAATCRWTFVCYEECEMYLKVVFINELSREYQFYNIVATVTPSKIVSTVTFEARAREILQKEIIVANPLAQDTEFDVHCDQLSCAEKLTIYRNSEATLVLTYSPLVVGETEDYLQVINPLAGCFLYKVILKCLPAKEKYLEFTTPLGTSIPIRLRVQNRTDVRADFNTLVTHASIQAEKEYTLTAFEKGKFLVRFEPIQIGEQNCKVSFNSLVAGEFVFNIRGIATEPKPMGPYDIKAGGSTMIKFKNVFEETRMFKISVDRDVFYLKSFYEPLKAKKEIKVQVSLADNPGSEGWQAPTGCLTIESYDPPEPMAKWTYFLQGI